MKEEKSCKNPFTVLFSQTLLEVFSFLCHTVKFFLLFSLFCRLILPVSVLFVLLTIYDQENKRSEAQNELSMLESEVAVMETIASLFPLLS